MDDVNSFVEKTLELLNLEREAEINESRAFYENVDSAALENKGFSLQKLAIFGRKTGLYGRVLVTLGKAKGHFSKNLPLPAHCITVGDIVGLSYSSVDSNVTELSSGIVTRVVESSIVVAFEETFDSQVIDEDRLMRVTRLANDVTFKRMKRALEALCVPSSCCSSHFISVVFGQTPVGEALNLSSLQKKQNDKGFFNMTLNKSQQDAVIFALSCPDVGIIHGPPGTGKTTTVVEVIVQAVKNYGLKILACAPSNIAVDNILERLTQYKVKAVRLGHPARVMEKIHSYSLDAILDSSPDTMIVKDVRKDIDTALRNLQSSQSGGERARLRTEIKTLRKELRQREEKALKQILQNAEVILSTNVSASIDGPLKHLPKDHFDLVVVDEAAQSLEAACWIPLLWATRCVLAGDHKQLPPTIMSHDAAQRGLELTLMERLIKLLGDKVVHMLTTQYRMNEEIMRWSSEQLYDGRLLADVSVAQHLLNHLPGVSDTELTSLPLLMIDTAGCDLYELQAQDDESKGNEGEADVVAAHIQKLVESGVKEQNIGVITPYNLQVELLRSRLFSKYPTLEIKSVDGFQGREKEGIVISLVRSNVKGEIGFLAEKRRMNVAITRARRHLTVVGDSSTVGRDPFLSSLFEYISENGEMWSAENYRSHITGDNTRIERVPNTKASKEQKSKLKHCQEKSKISNTENRQKKSIKTPPDFKSSNTSPRERQRNKSRNAILDIEGQRCASAENAIKLERQIKAFLDDPRGYELVFSTDLTSQERFTVHSLAEKFGLEHVSKGTGGERFIAVAKKLSSNYSKSETKKISKELECNTEVTESERNDTLNICQICRKQMPTSNINLHEVRCERKREKVEDSNSDNITGAVGDISSQSKPKKIGSTKAIKNTRNMVKMRGKKDTVENSEKSENMENFDDLLSEFTKEDSQCALPDCKKSILTLGQKCQYCLNVYCLGHHFPEIHGCTQAAKEHARSSKGPPKQMSRRTNVKRGHLERKLDDKIKEMEGKRKTKQKDGK